MKHSLQWAVNCLEKPGSFFALQILAGLVSANAAGVLLNHFEAFDYLAVASIGHSGDVLHSIPILARLSGDIEVISVVAPISGAFVGALPTIALGTVGKFSPRERCALYERLPVISAEQSTTSESVGGRHEREQRAPLGREHSDTEIAERARSVLRWKIRYDSIRVTADKGHLTLFGEVNWNLDREAAEQTVRKLSGVVGVTNLITAKAPHGESVVGEATRWMIS